MNDKEKYTCPMCGGRIILHPRDLENLADVDAVCMKCSYKENFATMEQAIEAWNKRA